MVFVAQPTVIRLVKAQALASAAVPLVTVEALTHTAAMDASPTLASVPLRSRLLHLLPPLLLQLHLVLRVRLRAQQRLLMSVRHPVRLQRQVRFQPLPRHPAWQCNHLPARRRLAQCQKMVFVVQTMMTPSALALVSVIVVVSMDSVGVLMASVARDASLIMGHAQEPGRCRRLRDPCRLLHPP